MNLFIEGIDYRNSFQDRDKLISNPKFICEKLFPTFILAIVKVIRNTLTGSEEIKRPSFLADVNYQYKL